MNRKYQHILLALSLLMIIPIVACDQDNNDGQNQDYYCHDVWVDSSTNLMWQTGELIKTNLDFTVTYCDSLVWGGYSDWRAPRIKELRTLIRGCENTEIDGACNVGQGCSHYSCRNSSCDGCDFKKGPATAGRYWPPDLGGPGLEYWSGTIFEEFDYEYIRMGWAVDFSTGKIELDHYFGDHRYIRCVRDAEKQDK